MTTQLCSQSNCASVKTVVGDQNKNASVRGFMNATLLLCFQSNCASVKTVVGDQKKTCERTWAYECHATLVPPKQHHVRQEMNSKHNHLVSNAAASYNHMKCSVV